jgi:hypothetical protein
MICPHCAGEGGWQDDYFMSMGVTCGPWYDCLTCLGKGRVSLWLWLRYQFQTHAPISLRMWLGKCCRSGDRP